MGAFGMRGILLALALTLCVANAFGAQARNYGGGSYSGRNAGYLVMSISQPRAALLSREVLVILDFHSFDRLVIGSVNYGNHNILKNVLKGDLVTPDFKDTDEEGIVVVRALPPGDYEFFQFSGEEQLGIRIPRTRYTVRPGDYEFFPLAGENRQAIARARYSMPFTIKAGETTYLGNFHLLVRRQTNGFPGLNSFSGYFFRLTDENSRDLAIAKNKKPLAAGPVNVAVADEVQLHAPLFNSNPDVSPIPAGSIDTYSRPWDLIFETDVTGAPRYATIPAEIRVRQRISAKTYEQAISLATEAVEAGDLWPYAQADAYRIRGVARLGLHEADEAIADFNRAIAIDPFDIPAFANRAIAYRDSRKFDQAIADHTKVLTSFPETAGNLSDRALTYLASRQYDLALADFNEAIRLAPKDPVLYGNRGNVYRATGKLDLAISDFSRAIDLKRFKEIDPVLYRDRGYAYLTSGQFQNAFADFDKIIYLRISGAENYSGRCVALAAMGKAEDAMRDCDKALMMDGNSAAARYSRGYAYFKLSQFARAIEDYNAAIHTEPRVASSLYGRGVAKMKSGDAAGGALDMDEARQIDGEIADKMAKLGVAP